MQGRGAGACDEAKEKLEAKPWKCDVVAKKKSEFFQAPPPPTGTNVRDVEDDKGAKPQLRDVGAKAKEMSQVPPSKKKPELRCTSEAEVLELEQPRLLTLQIDCDDASSDGDDGSAGLRMANPPLSDVEALETVFSLASPSVLVMEHDDKVDGRPLADMEERPLMSDEEAKKSKFFQAPPPKAANKMMMKANETATVDDWEALPLMSSLPESLYYEEFLELSLMGLPPSCETDIGNAFDSVVPCGGSLCKAEALALAMKLRKVRSETLELRRGGKEEE